MKNFEAFTKVAQDRINQKGGDLEKVLDTAKALMFAGVEPARIYAYCKTGEYSKARATPAWHAAITEFYTVVKGH